MAVLIIIIAFLLVLNLIPLGIDGGYEASELFLSLKAGPFRVLRILPAKPLSEEKKLLRQQKKAKKQAKKNAKKGQAEENAAPKPRRRPDKALSMALISMGLHALKRLRHRMSIDLLKLHFVSGGDPYSAAMNYGYASAAFGIVLPLLDSAFNIGERDVSVSVDFDTGQASIDVRLILTIQLWEIIYIAAAFAVEFIRYKINDRRKAAAEADAQSDAA